MLCLRNNIANHGKSMISGVDTFSYVDDRTLQQIQHRFVHFEPGNENMRSKSSAITISTPELNVKGDISRFGEQRRGSSSVGEYYLTHLNMTSADVRRRLKEKEFVEEAIEGIKRQKESNKTVNMEEKKKNMEMLKNYHPWGKPGGGAPRSVSGSNTRQRLASSLNMIRNGREDDEKSVLSSFGKPGNGAPLRTNSGRIKTQIAGETDIRFQDVKNGRDVIDKQLRYKGNIDDKKSYFKDLERMIEYKEQLKQQQNKIEQTNSVDGLEKSYVFQYSPKKHKKKRIYPDDPEGHNYNPWNKGLGNPERDNHGNVRRHKFTPSRDHSVQEFEQANDTSEFTPLNVGRGGVGGAGAPIRSQSGKIKTQLPRTLQSQNVVNEGKQNQRRRITDEYEDEADEAVALASINEQSHRRRNYSDLSLMEKLGWSISAQPIRRNDQAKRDYLNTLQKEMEEKDEKIKEEKNYQKDGGMGLASLMKRSVIGKPKKDSFTGELLNQHKIGSDITYQKGAGKLDKKSELSKSYHDILTKQSQERQRMEQEEKSEDLSRSLEHIDSWNGLWGKPGNGAPLNFDNHHRVAPSSGSENLEPFSSVYHRKVLKSKHTNSYQVDPRKHIIGDKAYEFKIPFASVNTQ